MRPALRVPELDGGSETAPPPDLGWPRAGTDALLATRLVLAPRQNGADGTFIRVRNRAVVAAAAADDRLRVTSRVLRAIDIRTRRLRIDGAFTSPVEGLVEPV